MKLDEVVVHIEKKKVLYITLLTDFCWLRAGEFGHRVFLFYIMSKKDPVLKLYS